MPTPDLNWITYEVEIHTNSPLNELTANRSAALELVEETADVIGTQIQIPDLRAWSSPLDKAELLLETAAEIEHALMIQYLYAAYSLKHDDEVTDPGQINVLDQSSPDSWHHILLGIAREEMGHLMTVQNLLLLLGLPPNLEREDFPTRKNLYPFPLQLEPLTQNSLAKYVVAEAPADAAEIDDIVSIAQGAAGAVINHVGILYGLLGLVFSAPADLAAGGSGSPQWDEMLRHLAAAAYQQAPPEDWHLPETAFDPSSASQQANPDDWEIGHLRVHKLNDRLMARQAIRDIGEQGEGPTNAGGLSHFERFLGIYRGQNGSVPFPAPGAWIPTRKVPVNPKPGTNITDPRAKRWAELADLRYALLLGYIEHYLLASGDDRELLVGWIFTEMRSRLGFIARKLTDMENGADDSRAGVPFSLPAPLHLPGAETMRWTLHKTRVEAAIAKIEEIRLAGTGGDSDHDLDLFLGTDQARLAFITERIGTPAATVSFIRDILPLFRPVDIEHMIMFGLDLSQYEEVRAAAVEILNRIKRNGGGRMPPIPDQKWTEAQIGLFEKWIAEGFPQ